MKSNKSLLLALGNDIMGDDAVGLHVARSLHPEYAHSVDVIETPVAGFALLDLVAGYDNVLIVDAICTGTVPPGTVREFEAEDFSSEVASSPHYVGLPDILSLAGRLSIAFPHTIRILAMEIRDPFDLREGLSEEAKRDLPSFINAATVVLQSFLVPDQTPHPSPFKLSINVSSDSYSLCLEPRSDVE